MNIWLAFVRTLEFLHVQRYVRTKFYSKEAKQKNPRREHACFFVLLEKKKKGNLINTLKKYNNNNWLWQTMKFNIN